MTSGSIYDLAISTDWEYDWEFIQLVEQAAQNIGLTTYIIKPWNLEETIQLLNEKRIYFKFLLDRASDTSQEFYNLQKLIPELGGEVFEPLENLKWASDKATMHLEFIANGLHTPYTIILPPFDSMDTFQLSLANLAKLGRPFIIKPANTTGGGVGVVDGAETLQDILKARQEYHSDKYLLQEKVIPMETDGRRFWFRGFYTCGLVQCAWWNDIVHEYNILKPEDIRKFKLQPLIPVVRKIAKICKLHLFSTEIARTKEGSFVVVDYVNESCDMRLKSHHFDGVPDEIVNNIAYRITSYVKNKLYS